LRNLFGDDQWLRFEKQPLYLDQTESRIEITREEVTEYYAPIASIILSILHQSSRLVIGIAGPPGSGKSAFATILSAVINSFSNREISMNLGLDGWHFPNDYLGSHKIKTGHKFRTLSQLKGAPETFDVAAAYKFLQRIKLDEEVDFPVYSRKVHDPVFPGGTVTKENRIILFEGNYLLIDELPWRQFRFLFDLGIYLDLEVQQLLEGLRQRHLRGGKSALFVEQHIQNVDMPDIMRVLPSIQNAQIVVHKADNRKIKNFELQK
jgi:pantothenate kinase